MTWSRRPFTRRLRAALAATTLALTGACAGEELEELAGHALAASTSGTALSLDENVVTLGQAAILLNPADPQFIPGSCIDQLWLHGDPTWGVPPAYEKESASADITLTRWLVESATDFENMTSGGFSARVQASGAGARMAEVVTTGRRSDDYRVYFVVKLDFPMVVERTKNDYMKLGKEAGELADHKKYAAFFASCGNQVVKQVTYGGQLLAVFEIHNRTREEYLETTKTLALEISSSASLNLGDDMVKSQKLRERLSSTKAEIVVKPINLDHVRFASLEELEGFVDGFSEAMKDPKNWRQLSAVVDHYRRDKGGPVVLEQGDFGGQFGQTQAIVERLQAGLEACEAARAGALAVRREVNENPYWEILFDAGGEKVASVVEKIVHEADRCIADTRDRLKDCAIGLQLGEGQVKICSDEPVATVSLAVPRRKRFAEIPPAQRFVYAGMATGEARHKMLTCPIGQYLGGYWDNEWSAKGYCYSSLLTRPWTIGEEVALDAAGCPAGYAMTGHHVVGQRAACAPLPGYEATTYKKDLQVLGTLGVFCAEGEVLRTHNARLPVPPLATDPFSEELFRAAPLP
jgi:hypothetical protein